MKRIILDPLMSQMKARIDLDIENTTLHAICDSISELLLLKDLPFAYIIPDEKLLPPESIRFFYLDENWLKAFTDGAISIGRVCDIDAFIDGKYFEFIVNTAIKRLAKSRFKTMHPNHRTKLSARETSGKSKTGFLLRSELVSKWKGIEIFGYNDNTQLEILRMVSITNEIIICIFDDELSKVVISEPKTALRFGTSDNKGVIILRDLSDDENFGKPLSDKKINLSDFTQSNGKINVLDLAKTMQDILEIPIRSSQFAFELISVAKRAEFLKGGEALEGHNYTNID